MSYVPLDRVEALVVKDIRISSNTATTNNTNPTVVDSFSIGTFRSAKYETQITDGTDYHVSEIRVLHTDTQAYVTEYAIVTSNAVMGTFSVTVSGGILTLFFTASTSSNKTIKVARTAILT